MAKISIDKDEFKGHLDALKAGGEGIDPSTEDLPEITSRIEVLKRHAEMIGRIGLLLASYKELLEQGRSEAALVVEETIRLDSHIASRFNSGK
jgi:hypothetical protein